MPGANKGEGKTYPDQSVLHHVGRVAELTTNGSELEVGVWVVEGLDGGLKMLQPFPHAHY